MIAHRLSAAFVALAVLCAAAVPALAGKRVALVVGNSAYRSVPALANPANDARLVARTLAGLGFTVIGGGARLDLDRAHFAAAVEEFGRALPGAEVALFYYAGHGMQVDGENWLVPIDANPTRATDLDFQMVDAALVLKQMQGAGAALNVVVLDACRNNPFGGRGLRGTEAGLAQMHAPPGTVISYATQPGAVAADGAGSDSPYSLALVEAMRQPGLDVLRMFNRVGVAVQRSTGGVQQPWVSTSPIEDDWYFAGGSGDTPAPLPAVAPAPAQTAAARLSAAAPPGRLLDRVAAAAKPEGIPLPPFLDVEPAAPEAPRDAARFLGAWGPGAWDGGQDRIMFVGERMDRSGAVQLAYMQSFGCMDTACTRSLRGPKVRYLEGRIAGGVLTADGHDGHWTFVLEISADGQLRAASYRDGTMMGRAVLPPLP